MERCSGEKEEAKVSFSLRHTYSGLFSVHVLRCANIIKKGFFFFFFLPFLI